MPFRASYVLPSLGLLLVAAVGAQIPQSPKASTPVRNARDLADVFAETSPAVVQIEVQNRGHKHIASGSGFVISCESARECTVLTNYHVVRSACRLKVFFLTGLEVEASVVLGIAPGRGDDRIFSHGPFNSGGGAVQVSTGVSSRVPHSDHDPSYTATSSRPIRWSPSASTQAVTPDPQVVTTGRDCSIPASMNR